MYSEIITHMVLSKHIRFPTWKKKSPLENKNLNRNFILDYLQKLQSTYGPFQQSDTQNFKEVHS